MTRPDGRDNDELRPVTFERDYTEMAAGSCLVSFGRTRVLCTASVDDDVPRWMRGSGKGWVTAEYSMLPGSSPERVDREAARGKQSGRTVEIQRLIGRSLRAACDMTLLGERQVVVDCDVLQADGGTRTASICGGYLALHDALTRLIQRGSITTHPLQSFCAAISVGIVDGIPVLDLPYVEDSRAEVDMNVVMLRPPPAATPASSRSKARPRGWRSRGRARLAAGARRRRSAGAHRISRPRWWRSRRRRADGLIEGVDAMTATRSTLVCASANPDKVAEIEALLAGAVELLPRPASIPDVVEDADTLVGNARLKAVAIVDAVGMPAVADDTGLEVDALDGAPGVHTGRYAGPDCTYADNRHKLLGALAGIDDRRARFRTVAMVVWPTGASWRSKVCARDRSASPSGGVGDGATTRCSSPPMVTVARSPRWPMATSTRCRVVDVRSAPWSSRSPRRSDRGVTSRADRSASGRSPRRRAPARVLRASPSSGRRGPGSRALAHRPRAARPV